MPSLLIVSCQYNKSYILDNWNKFKSFIYISLFVHNLISKAICISECMDFCLQLCFSEKRKNNTHKTFHILKMKAHFQKQPHFENEMRLKEFRSEILSKKQLTLPILKCTWTWRRWDQGIELHTDMRWRLFVEAHFPSYFHWQFL